MFSFEQMASGKKRLSASALLWCAPGEVLFKPENEDQELPKGGKEGREEEGIRQEGKEGVRKRELKMFDKIIRALITLNYFIPSKHTMH